VVRRNINVLAFSSYVSDLCLTLISFYLAYVVRATLFPGYESLLPVSTYHWLILFILPIWSLVLYWSGAYRVAYKPSVFKEVVRLASAVAVSTAMLSAVVFLTKSVYLSRLFMVTFAALDLVALIGGRVVIYLAGSTLFRTRMNRRNVVVVGDHERAREFAELIRRHKNWGLRFIGFISESDAQRATDVLGPLSGIQRLVGEHCVDEVIFAVSRERVGELEDVFLMLEDLGVNARLMLDIFPHMIARVHMDELDGIPLLTFTTLPTNDIALFLKRLFDVAASFSLLVLLSPILAFCAVVIRLTSPGPVIFTQDRCGINGRLFSMYKFRSMYVHSEEAAQGLRDENEMDGPVFKIKKDPRVTPFGRLMRRMSIDELPQLYNVLRGDMSMVGPRPPVPDEVARYERWQRRRLSMKPGLTCIWQVSGRNRIQFHEWMKLDLQYIDNWSLWLDIKIIFKTIPAVLSGKGAY